MHWSWHTATNTFIDVWEQEGKFGFEIRKALWVLLESVWEVWRALHRAQIKLWNYRKCELETWPQGTEWKGKKIFCTNEGKFYVTSKQRGKAGERGRNSHHMAKAMERKYLDNSILTRYRYCKVSAMCGWVRKAVFLKGKTRRIGVVVLSKIWREIKKCFELGSLTSEK